MKSIIFLRNNIGQLVLKLLFVFISLFSIYSTTAFAGSQLGNVVKVIVRASDNLHYFYMTGDKIDGPACARNSYWMIKDENSVAGRSQLAQLLAAQASGKRIQVYGSNTCARWGDGEDANSIVIQTN